MPEPSEATKPSHSASNTEGDKPKQLDQGIKEMVSMLTEHVVHLQRGQRWGPSNPEAGKNKEMLAAGEGGVRIITLAGTNSGATMRSELDDRSLAVPHHSHSHGLSSPGGEPDSLATHLVNSNFQAINNSIMLGGSHRFKDPGVHMHISPDSHDDEDQHHQMGELGSPMSKHSLASD